jgi:hypothetical protein
VAAHETEALVDNVEDAGRVAVAGQLALAGQDAINHLFRAGRVLDHFEVMSDGLEIVGVHAQ